MKYLQNFFFQNSRGHHWCTIVYISSGQSKKRRQSSVENRDIFRPIRGFGAFHFDTILHFVTYRSIRRIKTQIWTIYSKYFNFRPNFLKVFERSIYKMFSTSKQNMDFKPKFQSSTKNLIFIQNLDFRAKYRFSLKF